MPNAVGIDVSQYQSPTWPTAGLDFAIIKGAFGSHSEPTYDAHYRRATAAGIPSGAYLFCRGQDPAAQVLALLSQAPKALFYVADYEADTQGLDVSHDQMRAIIRRLQSTGKQVGAYATPGTMHDWGQDFNWYAGPFGHEPPEPWTFHQQRSGQAGGDTYNGSPDELKGWLGMPDIRVAQEALHSVRVPNETKLYDLSGQQLAQASHAMDETPSLQVTLGTSPTRYWMTTATVKGVPRPVLVKAGDVTDKGALQVGGATPAQLAQATAQGFADAKAKAIAAVQGI